MIDIHCHILPGLDDGPKTEDESIMMVKKAAEEGITTIIATPHHHHPSFENPGDRVLDAVEKLNKRIKAEQININILPGQEVRITGGMAEDIDSGEVITLANGGTYLFIEFPSNHVPRFASSLIYQLQVKGIIPIIVHPERNKELMEKPELLYEFVKNGVLTQVTSSSITGHFGKKIKQFSEQIIEANLTHFVASDAHNIETRTFRLASAYAQIETKFGTGTVYQFQENAILLAENKHVAVEQPDRIKRRKILGIF
ncbi:CpsB/CapC family capsule biosynthesis tyrosine phosphatase [Alkalihalobacillus sp. LMS39]|uniref:tyrosine-protein phosphatase n=1 Tax=Alkalihalobacillus sp. LMS39 TaxID=2924032 RepID=UPI001FB447BD|nr:CpsB/CapC family capsule biosynthesis tyrosine phosphatase [Alkalihalobacillus sp. LMS39]UOE93877.1 tyrosine protein phosphatase [Alkalihalobacillus sp. LMS39]